MLVEPKREQKRRAIGKAGGCCCHRRCSEAHRASVCADRAHARAKELRPRHGGLRLHVASHRNEAATQRITCVSVLDDRHKARAEAPRSMQDESPRRTAVVVMDDALRCMARARACSTEPRRKRASGALSKARRDGAWRSPPLDPPSSAFDLLACVLIEPEHNQTPNAHGKASRGAAWPPPPSNRCSARLMS